MIEEEDNGGAYQLTASEYDSHARIRSKRVALMIHEAIASQPDNDRILDIGIGTGLLWKHVFGMGPIASTVTGVDVSGAMLALARPLQNARLNLVCSNATALPFLSGSFGTVLFSFSAKLVSDLPGAVEQVRAVLKPAGCVIVADYSARTYLALAELGFRFYSEFESICGHTPKGIPLSYFVSDEELARVFDDIGYQIKGWEVMKIEETNSAEGFLSWFFHTPPIARDFLGMAKVKREEIRKRMLKVVRKRTKYGIVSSVLLLGVFRRPPFGGCRRKSSGR